MALREVRELGDPVLFKKARPIKEMTERYRVLIEDMFETMYENDGCGLAAPQVGVLRRIFIIDVGEEEPEPHVFINPEIIETDGAKTDYEGCLSIPGKTAKVTRPTHVKVKALNEDMEEFELETDDELMARSILHENDHLEGKLYNELAEGPLMDVEDDEEAEPDVRGRRQKRIKRKWR